MLSVQGFREAFPQFDEELFPDARVGFFLTLAGKLLAEERWRDLWPEGCYLHAAHHLTLERAATRSGDGAGGMDAAAGPVLSVKKRVGDVSLEESRAGAATASSAAGHWSDTVYGKQYWQLAQIVGAGGLIA